MKAALQPARSLLVAAARRYLELEPWMRVPGEYLVGLHDRATGRLGCASVLGNSGQEYGLWVLFGEEGFALLRGLASGDVDQSEAGARADGVSLLVTDVAPASRDFWRLAPLLLEQRKVRVGDARGYLTGCRHRAGHGPSSLDLEETTFLRRCLEAVSILTMTGRLGADEPEVEGRQLVYDLLGEDGRLNVQGSHRPLEMPRLLPEPARVPAEVLARIRARRRVDVRLFLSVHRCRLSVQGAPVWSLLILDETGFLLSATVFASFDEAVQSVFSQLAGDPARGPAKERAIDRPREVWVDSKALFEALCDALNAAEVRLVYVEDLPELQHVRESLDAYTARNAP